MLRLWFSPLQQTCTDRVIAALCKGAVSGVGRQILIVPEQFSFDTERALCRAGGDTIPRFAEVLSFSRLASRVFSVVGGAAVQTLDKSGRLIAMAGALEQVRSRLKIYGTYIAKPEFLLQLLQISDEFKSYGVSSEAIRRIAPTLTGTLAEKMDELSLIMEAYDAVCAASKLDPATRLDALCTALAESDYADGREIFVVGFSDFTAQELQVLCELMRHAENVTVALCCDGLLQGQTVFSVVRDTAAALMRLAAKYETGVEQFALEPAERPACLAHLRQHLFSAEDAAWDGKAENLCLSESATVSEECLCAVAQIQRLLLHGCRLRELAVAYTDAAYLPALETAFSRYALPCYFAGSTDVLRENVLRGVLAALQAAACGMDADDVQDYLSSGLSLLDADDCDRLKNYIFMWNIRGSLWEEDFTFDPQGYEGRDPAQSDAQLCRLNEARQTAIVPLLTLRDGLHAAKNTAQQVLALHRFLNNIGLQGQLEARAQKLVAEGHPQRAQQYSQFYDVLLDSLEQIYAVLGESVRTPEDFCRFFRATLGQHTVGTVPATLDCIHVGPLSAMRSSNVKHLLLLGATDGLLPAGTPAAGLLSDRERKTLTELGLTLAPDSGAQLERDLLCAYLVLTAPVQSLYVSCKKEEACYLYERLKALFPDCQHTHALPLPVTAVQAASEALRQNADIAAVPELATVAEKLQQRAQYSPGHLSAPDVEALYGSKIGLSASKVDRFASCRYAFFLQYGLRVKQQMQATVDASMFGTFVHDVLENTARQVMDEGGFRSVTEERLNELANSNMETFVRERLNGLADKTPREVYLFRRSLDEVRSIVRDVWKELQQSDFVPEGFELEFGGENAIEIQGQCAVAQMVGKIDRVDLFRAGGRVYLRVIDYKTGKKDFDYTDILNGMGLQMLIYLFTLQAQADVRFGSEVVPAGVLYVPARMDVMTAKQAEEKAESERQGAFKRKGLLLDDETVLSAMEPEVITPKYLPYKFVKTRQQREGSLASEKQLADLRRFVFRKLADMTDDIRRGQIAPNPYERGPETSSCKYCDYRTVCHTGSGRIPMRSLKKTETDRFWQEVGKGANADG